VEEVVGLTAEMEHYRAFWEYLEGIPVVETHVSHSHRDMREAAEAEAEGEDSKYSMASVNP
jgi:hypothetical protein